MDGIPEVFLDPNEFSTDGTVNVEILSFSHDNKYLAYSKTTAGSDWQEIHVMEIATRSHLPNFLRWAKFTQAAWQGEGFYYSCYDRPPEGAEFSAKNEFHKVYYHNIFESQEKDQLIFEDKTVPNRYYQAEVTEDEDFLIIYALDGTGGNEVYLKNLTKAQAEFKKICEGFEYKTFLIGNVGHKLFFHTNEGAPLKKVVLIDSQNIQKEAWEIIIPESEYLLEGVLMIGKQLFANYLIDASEKFFQYSLEGSLQKEIDLPALGSITRITGRIHDQELFFGFTSFTYPHAIYRYDIQNQKLELFKKIEAQFNPDDYEARQVFYSSKDGTKVPLFLVHKKGLQLNGENPTLLYGYGGFGVCLGPFFSVNNLFHLENNGIFALAILRGGGEYGEKWHDQGKLLNKQNCFDDFIAAAEYLIKEKYTKPEKLIIEGGSNGGLLVGACVNQRPDLFKVALCHVGVMDMLRYQKFTVGWGWVTEYGSSEEEVHFKNLFHYSPLHNISSTQSYPAVLALTADHDDRVVPAHSYKYIATLQEKNCGSNPTLIRIQTKAGHGAGKPLTMTIEEVTDKWSFIYDNLGLVYE